MDNAGAVFAIFADFLELDLAFDVLRFGTAILTPPFFKTNY